MAMFARVEAGEEFTQESIVLTGGSSWLPLVRDKLKRAFPQAMLKETINAEGTAAIGAAIIA